ncbi:hypothetical protein BamMEX5DRAFT_6774 [Burkholderia ambifaria MEX-5]|uniref:Uncharacterized protein n=1 Tax=Burkholderia ambifaria MEX-5 TaxID=396597 RepID=B1TG58_9BURK|nr:hypothetical protein BamMEX5DRAFT_6774 [Burkholderia ambifaria MEX-5]
MVVALHDVQRVRRDVLRGDEPWLSAAVLAAAEADALALAERVEREADVLADHLAVRRLHRARFRRKIAVQEVAERPFADEADARRVLLLRVRQADLRGDLAHLRLRDLAEREHRLRQLRLVQPVQEVRLVFRMIERLQQFEATVALAHARVVAGRDHFRVERHRVIEERLELDLGVAQHVGVRRAAGRVFAQEFGEHAVLVLGREVHRFHVDADQVGDRHDVDPVLARRAVFAVVIVFPVLHEQADHVVPLFLQQPRGHRRIDAARHAHDYTALGHLLTAWRSNASGRGATECVCTKSSGMRRPAR